MCRIQERGTSGLWIYEDIGRTEHDFLLEDKSKQKSTHTLNQKIWMFQKLVMNFWSWNDMGSTVVLFTKGTSKISKCSSLVECGFRTVTKLEPSTLGLATALVAKLVQSPI